MTKAFLDALQTKAASASCFPACFGPWWRDEAPANAESFPYVVYFNVGAPIEDRFTDGSFIEQLRIQFSVFTSGDNANAFAYSANLRTALDRATITLSSGLCLGVLCIAEPYAVPVPGDEKDATGNPVYHVATDYRFFLA